MRRVILLVSLALAGRAGADHLPPVHPLREFGLHMHEDHSGHDHAGESLFGIDLTDASLSGADLEAIDLNVGVLVRTNLSFARLAAANLSITDLTEANLEGADLTGAFLGFATLIRADLIDANLRFAHLTLADLDRADLSGADVSGANLNTVNLTGADLTNLFAPETDFSDATGLGSHPSHVGSDKTYSAGTQFAGTDFDPVAAGWTLVTIVGAGQGVATSSFGRVKSFYRDR